MNIGAQIARLRKEKGWSQNDLAEAVGASREIIGRYERGDAVPSVEMAKNIADVFEVTLDYLVGEGQLAAFDKRTLRRLAEIEQLPEAQREKLFYLIDAVIRDAKTQKAYAS